MGLKPFTTAWFEVLVAGDNVARAAEVLARTGRVQIESADELSTPSLPELDEQLARFEAMSRTYGPYWPSWCDTELPSKGAPEHVVAEGLSRLEAWAERADPVIDELQRLENEHRELQVLAQFLEHGQEVLPDLQLFRKDRNALTVFLLSLPRQSDPLEGLPSLVLRRTVETPDHRIEILVADADDDPKIAEVAEAAKARAVELPDWIPSDVTEALRSVRQRIARAEDRIAVLRSEIDRLHDEHGTCGALSDIRRLQWYTRQVPGARTTRNFAVLTGWTDDPCGERLEEALAREGLGAVVHFPPAPSGMTAPVVVSNPAWAKPFEVFSRMLGVPSTGEVEPAVILSLVAPLLFGYMFGDVGQGAVLLGVGLLLRNRYPFLRILIGGGLSAMVFGVLFGSVFSLEGIVPALWVHPMEHPLTVLTGSIYLGAAILLLGIVLHGLSAVWRRQISDWLRIDVSVALVYLGILLAFVDPRLVMISAAGAGWFVLWQLVGLRRGGGATLKDFGDTVEHLMRLAVNTVSFVRVGAFALAHAGLSSAIATLAAGTGHPVGQGVVLVFGNALILVLEGIVVSIQTTRLILFEFFVRFLAAEGRPFRPLAPPSPDPPPGTGDQAVTRSPT
ncbi:MAG: V-type ATP synthase subunit I [Myxococcota bacterium]